MRRVSPTGQPESRFRPFRLDGHGRRLTCDRAPVSIGGRALDILLVLARAAGETVGKAAFAQVWQGLSVEENRANATAGLRPTKHHRPVHATEARRRAFAAALEQPEIGWR
jgi:DNA-binding response OmpR family regulator